HQRQAELAAHQRRALQLPGGAATRVAQRRGLAAADQPHGGQPGAPEEDLRTRLARSERHPRVDQRRDMKPAPVLSVLLAVSAAASSVAVEERAAIAAEDVDAFARVVVESAEVRSGPGMSYRTIAVVERGDTISVDRRASDQFWLKITLDDGRSGWLLGEEVEVYAVHADEPDRPSRPGLFAPPPLVGAHGGLSLLGGVLGSRITDPATGNSSYSAADGYFEARPIFVVAPQVSIEAFGGLSRTDDGSLFLVGGWGVVH